MATIDELLKKQKNRLEKMSVPASAPIPTPITRKKITRTGPTRPWQENLPQYQSAAADPLHSTATPEASAVQDTIYEADTNLQQTEHKSDTAPDKVGTKLEQSQNKVGANPEQSQNKAGTKLEQSQNKVRATLPKEETLHSQSWNKVRAQLRTEVGTKLEQSQNKVRTKLPFSSVVGLQRRIILFIFEATKTSREKLTAPIAVQNLADACQTTSMAAQVTIRRLEKKGFLLRGEYKDGRGGWTRYEIPNDLFQELLQLETQNKLGTKLEQTWNKVRSQPGTELRTSLPSSSSSSYVFEELKTTTTSESELVGINTQGLPPGWQDLDFSALVEFGFTQSHLVQILKQGKLSETEVQDSIHFFAFDLIRNGKGSELNGSPLNFFMGILRKGTPYAPPANYESPADEARRRIREFKERKEQERLLEEEKILDLEFNQWRRGLSQTEVLKIVPEFARKPGPLHDSALKAHFENHIWPNLQNSLFEQESLCENTESAVNLPSGPVV